MLKVKLPYSCALVLVLNLVLVYSQGVQSPCPSIFDYESDGSRVYGKIVIQGGSTVRQLELQARFSVTGYIPNYGSIQLINEKFALQNFNQGSPLQYRIHFPEASSLPFVTAIVVNGNKICTGPDITPRPNQVITQFALKHVSYISGLQNSNTEDQNFQVSIQQEDDGIFYNEPYHVFNKPAVALDEYTPRPPRLPPTKRPQVPTRPPVTAKPFEEQFTFEQEHTTERPRPVATQRPTPSVPVQQSQSDDIECGTRSSYNNKLPLIYGGTSYRRGDIPWLVAIFQKKAGSLSFICGGTLVSNRHVVTAAHCMHSKGYARTISDLVIRVGVHNINEWSDDISVTRTLLNVSIPDSFDNATLKNDIMVLTFSKRVQFSAYIRPACLWDGDIALERIVGTSGTVAGWGNQKNIAAGEGEPHSVNIPIVDTGTCRASNVAFHSLTSDKTICAGDRKDSGPCTGDSGGGLYLVDGGKWRLRGVVSVSLSKQIRSCNLEEYVVFTDTAQYLPWIRKVLQKEYFD